MNDPTDPILVDMPMPIVTPRLILRPSKEGDGPCLTEAKRESWLELGKWLPFAEGPVETITDAGDEAFVRRKQAQFVLRQDIFLLAFDRATKQLIGTGGYHAIDWKYRIMSIGYWIRSSATGQGFATDIAIALTRYAFGPLEAARLAISHADGNHASRRVIEKLGFEKEGTTRGSYFLQGKPTDAHHYARLTDDALPSLAVSWGAG